MLKSFLEFDQLQKRYSRWITTKTNQPHKRNIGDHQMKARIITQFRSLLNTRQFNTEDRGKSSISNFIITGLLKHSSSRNDKVRRRLKTSLFLSLSLSPQTQMNTCQTWRAAIITSFPCTFLSFRRGLYYNIRTAHVDSAWQRGKRRTCGGIRPRLAHANIIGVSNGRKETRATRVERARAS